MENYHFIDPLKFLSEATSPYQTVIKSAEILKENGFEDLELDQDWKLEPGTDYFVKILPVSGSNRMRKRPQETMANSM